LYKINEATYISYFVHITGKSEGSVTLKGKHEKFTGYVTLLTTRAISRNPLRLLALPLTTACQLPGGLLKRLSAFSE
jgi:hypothetical protein